MDEENKLRGDGGLYMLQNPRTFGEFAAEMVAEINRRGNNCKCSLLIADADAFDSAQITDGITVGMANTAALVEVVLVESLAELKEAVAANYETKDTRVMGLYRVLEVLNEETSEDSGISSSFIDSLGNLLYNVAVFQQTTVIVHEPVHLQQLERWLEATL